MIDWTGVFPAVITPMTPDGAIDEAALARHVDRLVAAGVAGLVMMGMVGENSVLAPAEKVRVLRGAVAAAAGRVPVLSGLAELDTARAGAYAAEAATLGIQGLMVFPPLGYKTDPGETIAFHRAVHAASDLSIVIYNNPVGYGVDVDPAILDHLIDCPRIVAIKEESYDTRRITDIALRHGDRFALVCGVDDLVVESFALGATAWISGMANAFPAESVRLVDLIRKGETAAALRLYRAMTPLFHLDTHVKLVHYIKLACQLNGLGPEHMRRPRLPLEGAERAMVERTVADTHAALALL